MNDKHPQPKRSSTTAPPDSKGLRSVSSIDIHTLTINPSQPSPPPSATATTTHWEHDINEWEAHRIADQQATADMAANQQILDMLTEIPRENAGLSKQLNQQAAAKLCKQLSHTTNRSRNTSTTRNVQLIRPFPPSLTQTTTMWWPISDSNLLQATP